MKIIKWVVLALIVWWVINDPTGAGQEVHKLMGFAGHAASSITTALKSI